MKKLCCLLVFILCLAVLSGCGENTTAESATDPVETWETAPPETLGVAVDNSYMTFYYPQEWEGKVEEIREENDGNMIVTFRTDISGEEVVLFSIAMGPGSVDGYLLGWLDDPQAGEIYVYSIMSEIGPDDWSEEEYDQICALQERVNDIIVQFYQDERFVPSR